MFYFSENYLVTAPKLAIGDRVLVEKTGFEYQFDQFKNPLIDYTILKINLDGSLRCKIHSSIFSSEADYPKSIVVRHPVQVPSFIFSIEFNEQKWPLDEPNHNDISEYLKGFIHTEWDWADLVLSLLDCSINTFKYYGLDIDFKGLLDTMKQCITCDNYLEILFIELDFYRQQVYKCEKNINDSFYAKYILEYSHIEKISFLNSNYWNNICSPYVLASLYLYIVNITREKNFDYTLGVLNNFIDQQINDDTSKSSDFPSVDLSDFKFIASNSSGISIKHNKSDGNEFIVSVYAFEKECPIWENKNIQLKPKPMKFIEQKENKVTLRGVGYDENGVPYSYYGCTLYLNHSTVEKIEIHMFHKKIDLLYKL